jgi:arginyl-tRNA synthetase
VHERGQWLAKIYAEAPACWSQRKRDARGKAQREAYETERREMYRKWDAGDPAVRALWLETREWSMEELRDILACWTSRWMSGSTKAMWTNPPKRSWMNCSKGIAEDERPQGGPVIVKIDEKLGLSQGKVPHDGHPAQRRHIPLLTKDLALAKVKFEQYHVDRSIYVVDFRQSLHFQQVFKILELWGFPQAAKCYHLSYGYITLPEGAMSARRDGWCCSKM